MATPASLPSVDIVVVNYMSADHLASCLRSIPEGAAGVTITTTIVNNGDDMDIAAAARAAGAAVIETGANIGFGAACNRGARGGAGAGNAEFILFLNPDATLAPGCLGACAAFLRDPEHAMVGIVGPEISDELGRLVRSCSNIPDAFDMVLRATGLHVVLGERANTPFLALAAHQASGFVGQVMGAAMMVRRSLFEALGGFDERFFLYFEDLDFCARAAAKGARCYYLKSAHAHHVGRVSSARDSGRALALYLRSALTYARVHFGRGFEALLALAIVLVEFPLRLAQALFRGGVSRVLRAYGLLARQLILRRPIAAP